MAGLLAASLYSCSGSDQKTGSTGDTLGLSTDSMSSYDSATTVAQPADTASNQPMAFALKAGAGGMLEVELGNLSQTNAQHPRVKRFGQMMVKDHSTGNKELMTLATERNFNVPTTLPVALQMHVNELKALKGKDFDEKYMDMMVEDHNEDIKLFEEAAGHSTDQKVKAFAAKILPILKMHLDSAKAIRSAIK